MRLVWPVALGLALGVALALAPAPGAEGEAREVEVAGSSVRVRELAAVCGGQPDSRGLDLVIAADLRPGERRLVTAADIRARLSDLGFSDCGRPAAGEAVMVRRSARVLSASELIAAGEAAIRSRLQLAPGDEAVASPVMDPHPLLAPLGRVSLEAAVRSPTLPGGLWVAEITARDDEGWSMPVSIRYRVRVTGDVLVTRRSVARHEAFAEGDVTRERRDLSALRGDPIRSFAELAGNRAARPAAAGTSLTTESVESIPLVHRGESVSATARVGAVRAAAPVVALSDGGMGDVIRVRRAGERTEFPARVSGPGQVEVIVSP